MEVHTPNSSSLPPPPHHVAHRPPVPTVISIQQLVGRWLFVENKGFTKYMKELGVGMGAMAKPDCVITSAGQNLMVNTESTLKVTQCSCNLRDKFEETTADGTKTQATCNFVNSALVQHQEWDRKESARTRRLEGGSEW